MKKISLLLTSLAACWLLTTANSLAAGPDATNQVKLSTLPQNGAVDLADDLIINKNNGDGTYTTTRATLQVLSSALAPGQTNIAAYRAGLAVNAASNSIVGGKTNLSAWAQLPTNVLAQAGSGGSTTNEPLIGMPNWVAIAAHADQKLHLAFSNDGTNWQWALDDNVIFTDPDSGKAWNTTMIVRSGNGLFYCDYDPYEGIGGTPQPLPYQHTWLQSSNLINWAVSSRQYFTPTNGGNQAYAPQLFVDKDGSVWHFAVAEGNCYAAKALNDAFTSWSTAHIIVTGIDYDPVMINAGSNYVLWASVGGALTRYTNSNITSLFTAEAGKGEAGVLGHYDGSMNFDGAVGLMAFNLGNGHFRAYGEDERDIGDGGPPDRAHLSYSDSLDNGQTWTLWTQVLPRWNHGGIYHPQNVTNLVGLTWGMIPK